MEGGLPTGYMEENAFLGFQGRIPMPSAEDFLTAYGRAQELYASYGITTVQEGLMASQLVPLYQMLLKSGLLKLDLISFMDIRDSDAARTAFESHIKNYRRVQNVPGRLAPGKDGMDAYALSAGNTGCRGKGTGGCIAPDPGSKRGLLRL